ncbi:MAG: peptidoglycan DD-metalloendopeptidase family protein [Desulfobacterales bacterium]|jgi:murein DD-endopeptidase MepM/ murein hydrolase activator NlpD
MRKKISFVVLSNSGAPAKQICASKTLIRLVAVSLAACLIFFGYVVFDYFQLKKTTSHLQTREIYLTNELSEIQSQRKQIQEFANEINALKSHLVTLNNFEKKIRIIANIEKTDESANIFGIGGSIPEDLDARLPLMEKHNSLIRDMHEQIDELNRASIHQKDEFESLLKSLEDQQNLLASTPAIRPISQGEKSWTTSKFGFRVSPFTGQREFHQGFDISTRKGTPILSTADGVVTYVGNKGLLGRTIIIDHGHGMVTRYGHCQKFLKKRGEKVKRWEPVALVGNTGRSTGPHVHYEVHLNGVPVNPEKYILN